MANELITISPQGVISPLMEKLIKEKRIAREFQERRQDAWDEIYELNRNKVKTNRVTQRQSVNVPLMKETVKTLLSKIDDPPSVDWRELSGDLEKEIIFQEKWNSDYDRLNFEGIDLQDKKSVILYGRSFKKLNWIDGEFHLSALDVYDVIVDPLVDPLDLETARFVIHQNIFRSLRDILADDKYTDKGKQALKIWATSKDGMVQSAENAEEYKRKMERMIAMGVDSSEFPLFAAGDVIVNLTEHYTKVWDTKRKKFIKRVVVYADDSYELLNEELMDLMGIDFYPFNTWGEDVETNDFWSDGPADLVRIPNKIINIWFSQLIENRTLKNFQMHWYDATNEKYIPQTYEPGAGRMLPAPGDPNKTIMPVNISGLDDTMVAIDFVIKMVERGTAATATEKGVGEKKQITLGEVELLVGKAMERTLSMAKHYRRAWFELAMKYQAIVNANASSKQTLYKASRSGKIWPKTVWPSDWKSEKGFKPIVRSSSEQEEEKIKGIKIFDFLISKFPDNPALKRISLRRMLDIADLTPEELREVEDSEKQKLRQLEKQTEEILPEGVVPGASPALPVSPAGASMSPDEQALLSSLQQRLQELQTA